MSYIGAKPAEQILSSADIQDGAISTVDLADNSITRAKLDSNLQAGFQGRNKIINGHMVVDQRNAGASVTTNATTIYALDRWNVRTPTSTNSSIQQSSTAPTGFVNSSLMTIGTGASPAAADTNQFRQYIEGYNISDLGWGTANAKTITLSFWVRSSVTGTYAVSVRNNGSARSYVATYVVNASNTWEQKSVTIAGDTSGTWLTTNGVGLNLTFDLGSGSDANTTANTWAAGNYTRTSGCVTLVSTTGATFYITGVQLEEGTTATSFEREAYSVTLQKCYRYFQQLKGNGTYGWATNAFTIAISSGDSYGTFPYLATFRSAPTVTTSGTFQLIDQSNTVTISSISFDSRFTSTNFGDLRVVPASSSLTQYRVYNIRNANDSSAYINLSAEL